MREDSSITGFITVVYWLAGTQLMQAKPNIDPCDPYGLLVQQDPKAFKTACVIGAIVT